MANIKKIKDPAELRLRVEKSTKDLLKVIAIRKGISVNDLCRRYLRHGLDHEMRH